VDRLDFRINLRQPLWWTTALFRPFNDAVRLRPNRFTLRSTVLRKLFRATVFPKVLRNAASALRRSEAIRRPLSFHSLQEFHPRPRLCGAAFSAAISDPPFFRKAVAYPTAFSASIAFTRPPLLAQPSADAASWLSLRLRGHHRKLPKVWFGARLSSHLLSLRRLFFDECGTERRSGAKYLRRRSSAARITLRKPLRLSALRLRCSIVNCHSGSRTPPSLRDFDTVVQFCFILPPSLHLFPQCSSSNVRRALCRGSTYRRYAPNSSTAYSKFSVGQTSSAAQPSPAQNGVLSTLLTTTLDRRLPPFNFYRLFSQWRHRWTLIDPSEKLHSDRRAKVIDCSVSVAQITVIEKAKVLCDDPLSRRSLWAMRTSPSLLSPTKPFVAVCFSLTVQIRASGVFRTQFYSHIDGLVPGGGWKALTRANHRTLWFRFRDCRACPGTSGYHFACVRRKDIYFPAKARDGTAPRDGAYSRRRMVRINASSPSEQINKLRLIMSKHRGELCTVSKSSQVGRWRIFAVVCSEDFVSDDFVVVFD
jgi:hypothetical protein